MSFVVETRIAKPAEDVFDRMADVRNETAWNSQVSRAELVEGEPIGAGSRFVTVNRGKEYTATVTRYERPTLLAFDVSGSPMDIAVAFRLRPDGDGCVLVGEFDPRPKGVMKVLFPLLGPVMRRDLAKQSQRFKAFCEQA